MHYKKCNLQFLSPDAKLIRQSKKRNKAEKTPSEPISKMTRQVTTPALVLAAVIGANLPAQAVTFKFTYQPGVTQQQIEAVELAGNIWSSYLQETNLDINVHFAMTTGQLAAGKLGGATPAIKKTNYDKFKQGLQADGTANINLLPNSTTHSNKYLVRRQDGSIYQDYYELLMTTANNKALSNDIAGTASGLDAYIQLEQSINWNYNHVNGTIGGTQYDFVSVVLHELGHSLGFISGIDALSSLALPSALDMFRYSTESASQKALDYAQGGTKYFSTNGGLNPFSVTETVNNTTVSRQALFSTGTKTNLGGDGDQASHWKHNTQHNLGIMSSTLQSGQIRSISKFDLTAFDYIGWQVNHSATLDLPELFSIVQTKAQQIWNLQFDGNTGNDAIRNRSSEVQNMMTQSGIYDWGWGSYWQTANSTQSQPVPEPASIMGILGLALLGISSHLKTQAKK